MLELISTFIIHLIQATGYLGIFLLMTLESALIPIPSEVIMPFSGFLAQKGIFSLFMVVLAGSLGNLAGSLIGYFIGFFLEENLILRNIKKYGKFMLITEDDYKKAVNWFKKYGNGVVFLSRLIPAVRTFISLPAGVFRMNIWKFLLFTFLGSFIWSFLLSYTGFYLGTQWKLLDSYFRKFDILLFLLIMAMLLFYINHKLKILPFRRKHT